MVVRQAKKSRALLSLHMNVIQYTQRLALNICAIVMLNERSSSLTAGTFPCTAIHALSLVKMGILKERPASQ